MFEEQKPEFVGHIEYGQEWDCIVVAPATANNLGKVANGIADDMVTSTIIASSCDTNNYFHIKTSFTFLYTYYIT